MAVAAASRAPTRFEGLAHIRVGSATPPLHDHPDLEARLIRVLATRQSEDGFAARDLTGNDVVGSLHGIEAVRMLGGGEIKDTSALLSRLEKDGIIAEGASGCWDITKVGALLFARQLDTFGSALARKAPRVIFYEGPSRVKTEREFAGTKGYGLAFPALMDWVCERLPRSEQIQAAFRIDKPIFPDEALREVVANALIHQDLSVRGTGPMIEVFSDRLEVTNPGRALISVERLIDEPPRSRNETLAQLMRRMNFCEERGSGIDKVVALAELYQLPPPDFRLTESATVAVLFAPRPFAGMTKRERIRAAYQHACLSWVSGSRPIGNASLRKRFGMQDKQAAQISRVLVDSLDTGLIQLADPENKSKAQAKYVPFWVSGDR